MLQNILSGMSDGIDHVFRPCTIFGSWVLKGRVWFINPSLGYLRRVVLASRLHVCDIIYTI